MPEEVPTNARVHFLMDWMQEARMAGQVLYATLLGGVIGWEQERGDVSAGVATYAAVCLGACSFGLVSLHLGTSDPTRLAAQVVSGIGFLGAGVILRDEGKVTGLTTAATLWATASVGLATADSMFVLGTLTALILTLFRKLEKRKKQSP